jgi:hypothetical protein
MKRSELLARRHHHAPVMIPITNVVAIADEPIRDLRQKNTVKQCPQYGPVKSRTAVIYGPEVDYVDLAGGMFRLCNHCHKSNFIHRFEQYNRCPNKECGA